MLLCDALRKFSRFTSAYKVRKTLAEALVLSQINYCNVVYSQIPKYQINRLQRVQNTAAGYVLKWHVKVTDVISSLNWLPVQENIEYCIAKLTFQALNDERCPKYLTVECEPRRRNLRSENEVKVKHAESNTFQQQAMVFNELPQNIRQIENFISFKNEARQYYSDRALARALAP